MVQLILIRFDSVNRCELVFGYFCPPLATTICLGLVMNCAGQFYLFFDQGEMVFKLYGNLFGDVLD